jgi:hypothetical protein
LHANEYSAVRNAIVKKQLTAKIKLLEKQLMELAVEISNLIDADEKLNEKYCHIESIGGISKLSWATIIVETSGFETFEIQRQLVSYAGYDVGENQDLFPFGFGETIKKSSPDKRATQDENSYGLSNKVFIPLAH